MKTPPRLMGRGGFMGGEEGAARVDVARVLEQEVWGGGEAAPQLAGVPGDPGVVGRAALVPLGEQVGDPQPRLRIDDDEVRPESRLDRNPRDRARDAADGHLRHRGVRQVERHRHPRPDARRRERAHVDPEGAQLPGGALDGHALGHVPDGEHEAPRRHVDADRSSDVPADFPAVPEGFHERYGRWRGSIPGWQPENWLPYRTLDASSASAERSPLVSVM